MPAPLPRPAALRVAPDAPEVVRLSAAVLAPGVPVTHGEASGEADGSASGGGTLTVRAGGARPDGSAAAPGDASSDAPWLYARIGADGSGEVAASDGARLYAFAHLLARGEITAAQQAALGGGGLHLAPTLRMHRPLFDLTLTQYCRSARGMDADAYCEALARSGFTHVEVNALATSLAFEPGVQSEYYDEFYTYGAGLAQFVDSPLTRGLYPHEYLAANLNRVRKLAAAGRRYGLAPGFCAFEPRTLPEAFFTKYPTLRGARVDHPFRSHLPRYTLAQDHPATRAHVAAMVRALMAAVPDLAYLSVWTNDSGAGFEHTASLYVGRNGGPYLIREWRSHAKIAEAAAESAVRWLEHVQSTAAETNPAFEVVLRVEPFTVEHDALTAGMARAGDAPSTGPAQAGRPTTDDGAARAPASATGGLTIEAPSLLVRGYELPYRHPHYPEQGGIAGTIFHDAVDDAEAERLAAYRALGIEPKITYSAATGMNAEPLLGIPFPRRLHRKLTALGDLGVRAASAIGGLLHPVRTPYWPHPDILRAATLNPAVSADAVLHECAARWVGDGHAAALVGLWDDVEAAVERMPLVPLYSHFGFVWLRTWVRPLVPDIEAIPREDRLYYERFMVSTFNNPNLNDLGRDVLFDLVTQADGVWMTDGFDRNVLPRLADAHAAADALATNARVSGADGPASAVFADLRDRIRALDCWATTQRNTCAWVRDVHGALAADGDAAAEAAFRAGLDATIDRDVQNTERLLALWETSEVEWMLVSDVAETSFIYGENFGDLLRRKLDLTARYRDRAPRIDRDILWRLTPEG